MCYCGMPYSNFYELEHDNDLRRIRKRKEKEEKEEKEEIKPKSW